jgi:hypothetical protein
MAIQSLSPTAKILRGIVPKCLVCNTDLSGHHFAKVAMTIAAEENKCRVEELIASVRQHQWDALTGYTDFSPTKNAVIVYSIVGPHGSGMVILIRDPFELYEPAELYVQEKIDSDEVTAIHALIPAGDWQEL